MKKSDFQKTEGYQVKHEIMKHKEKIELIYKIKLDEEKKRILNQKMGELDGVIKENKDLKEELSRLRQLIKKNS